MVLSEGYKKCKYCNLKAIFHIGDDDVCDSHIYKKVTFSVPQNIPIYNGVYYTGGYITFSNTTSGS